MTCPNCAVCQRCGVHSKDLRTLLHGCMADMGALGIPFNYSPNTPDGSLYKLRVCKECRAGWMDAIQAWFRNCKNLRELTPPPPMPEKFPKYNLDDRIPVDDVIERINKLIARQEWFENVMGGR